MNTYISFAFYPVRDLEVAENVVRHLSIYSRWLVYSEILRVRILGIFVDCNDGPELREAVARYDEEFFKALSLYTRKGIVLHPRSFGVYPAETRTVCTRPGVRHHNARVIPVGCHTGESVQVFLAPDVYAGFGLIRKDGTVELERRY